MVLAHLTLPPSAHVSEKSEYRVIVISVSTHDAPRMKR